MTSNKKLRTSLVAILIFGLLVSQFEAEIVTNLTTEVLPIIPTEISATQTQLETYREEIKSYIEFSPVDEELLRSSLLLMFLTLKMAGFISSCILMLMLVSSKPWRRICHSKGLVMPFKDGKDTKPQEPFENSHFPKSIKKNHVPQ